MSGLPRRILYCALTVVVKPINTAFPNLLMICVLFNRQSPLIPTMMMTMIERNSQTDTLKQDHKKNNRRVSDCMSLHSMRYSRG